MTHGTYPYRKMVKYSAKKLLSALGGGKIAVHLLKQFHQLLSTQKVNISDHVLSRCSTSVDILKIICMEGRSFEFLYKIMCRLLRKIKKK